MRRTEKKPHHRALSCRTDWRVRSDTLKSHLENCVNDANGSVIMCARALANHYTQLCTPIIVIIIVKIIVQHACTRGAAAAAFHSTI